MFSELQILQTLSAVQNYELPVEDFADWIDVGSRDLHRNPDGVVKLVNPIRHLLAEYDRGFFGERALREKLEEIADGNNISVSLVADRQGYFVPSQRSVSTMASFRHGPLPVVAYSE
jgi:hypothetical protein